MKERKTKRKGGLWSGLVVSLAVFLLLCLVLEFGLRIKNRGKQDVMRDTRPNAARIFELIPGFEKRQKQTDFDVEVKVNSIGFREREFPRKKPAGTFRIVALGDSFTFGWGVEERDRMSRKLEEFLNARGGPVRFEALNFGVWMYAADQQFLVLKDVALAYSPDLVLSGFYSPHVRTIGPHVFDRDENGEIRAIRDPTLHFDERDRLRRDAEALEAGEPGAAVKAWRRAVNAVRPHSRLADMLARRLGLLFGARSAYSGDLDMLDPKLAGKWDYAWDKALEAVRLQARVSEAAGAEFVCFIVPRDVQVSREEWEPEYVSAMNEGRFESRLPQKKLLAFGKKENVRMLDLLPAFREHANGKTYFTYDPHWTPRGHELAAEEVGEYLMGEGLVPVR